jgi:aldehyde dehydrogenase (NAD+)
VTGLPTSDELREHTDRLLTSCGVHTADGDQHARTPITGGSLGPAGASGDVDGAVERAHAAFAVWRDTPAPVRGNVIRRLGELLREHKGELGELVSIEAGKIRSEGLGEVQEMIDICDFAVGLSRQLHGLTIASERPGHRLMETWHPIGPVGVISAFNFPVAVWSWNAALAVVAGDPVIWKPSDKTPLTALACEAIFRRAADEAGAPEHLLQVVLGGGVEGAALAAHEGVPVLSATGGRGPLRQGDPRARRQQRGDRRPVGRSRPRFARDRLLGGRHGGPAVHVAAAPDRPPLGPRRARRPDRPGLRVAADR